ncbi:hypothetical protein BH10CHL1_BH10CHL1_44670 [soil metagenome]
MSVYSLILMLILGISLFSSALILAACVTSSRSQQVVTQHSAKFVADKSFEALSSDIRKHQPIAGGSTLASSR